VDYENFEEKKNNLTSAEKDTTVPRILGSIRVS